MSYMKGFYKRQILCSLFLLFAVLAFAQELTPGAKLFMQNEYTKAIPVLENEIRGANPDPELYNYLGLAYMQSGNFQKAVDAFERGLNTLGTNKKVLYFNQGNAYYKLGNFQKAADSYSMTIIADPSFAKPLLNRANTYLKLNDIDKCMADYEAYLALCPDDPQADKIRQIMTLLSKEKDLRFAEEKRRQEEAERLRLEEQRLEQARKEQERLAQEKKAAEEERRRKLLEEVANSLKNSSDTTNMSAGAEEVLTYDDESEID
ncbi:tetratricopeptide repeat protein [Treponema sp.]|uniref:tetratricopeptide repeat protein n=1 Tax=Treponema sp. TaxID=166 RepID=UPI00298DA6D6|nr:tetratricopeptide repeat protein [Treponema sp.]MCR5612100.1 tetratricopeptide repeat protein [Treponema sp.]